MPEVAREPGARLGCWAYTVYNHMYHARAYVILCDEHGGIVNDPVLLRPAEDEIWPSISDSDVLLWARGLNHFAGYDVAIDEIDVAPVQIQGPKSRPLMRKLFGSAVDKVPYYGLWSTRLADLDVVVSRTGYSGEIGYEIYLHRATENADALWQRLLEAGAEFDIRVIAPNHVRRLEAGILSYGQDMDIETNPFEVGLDWQVDLDKADFIAKEALRRIERRGVDTILVTLPSDSARVNAVVVKPPFYDPKKEIPKR